MLSERAASAIFTAFGRTQPVKKTDSLPFQPLCQFSRFIKNRPSKNRHPHFVFSCLHIYFKADIRLIMPWTSMARDSGAIVGVGPSQGQDQANLTNLQQHDVRKHIISHCSSYWCNYHSFRQAWVSIAIFFLIILSKKNVFCMNWLEVSCRRASNEYLQLTVEPQWLEHLWDHRKLFET